MFNFIKKLFGNPDAVDLTAYKTPTIEPIQPVINTPPRIKTKTTVTVKKQTAPKQKPPSKQAHITGTKKDNTKKTPPKTKKK